MRICHRITPKVHIHLLSTYCITIYLYTKHPVRSITQKMVIDGQKMGERRKRLTEDDDKGVWWQRAFCYGVLIIARTSSAESFVAHENSVSRAWRSILVEGPVERWQSRLKYISLLCGLRCCVKQRRVSGCVRKLYTAWCSKCHWCVKLAYFQRTLQWVNTCIIGVSVTHSPFGSCPIDEDSSDVTYDNAKCFYLLLFYF